jgi:hypothetical protein
MHQCRAGGSQAAWCWKDHDAYKESFERVLRDLTIKR